MRYRLKKPKPLPAVSELNSQQPPSVSSIVESVLDARRKAPEGYFRPSMFWGCDRQNVYHYQMASKEPPKQDNRMLKILDIGTVLHELFQKQYFAEHYGVMFSPEVPVRAVVGSNDAVLQGHADGVLTRRSDGYEWLLEIKTVSPSVFGDLTQADPKHVVQASIYARLLGLRWISIYYFNKGASTAKEFHVEATDEIWDQIVERAEKLKKFVDKKRLPLFDANTCDPVWCNYSDRCRTEEGGCPSTHTGKKWRK